MIGLARLHELTGDTGQADAATFFWNTVTRDHSYVIGGNSEREHFGPPGRVASLLTDRTCEACNTYNMLRLTRRLWSWRQDSSYFDYFERAHINHIMAHQDPRTGMFVYFPPMTSGGRRQYSTPTDSFWCCVGSGMESHAKHGEVDLLEAATTRSSSIFSSHRRWIGQRKTRALTWRRAIRSMKRSRSASSAQAARATPPSRCGCRLGARLPFIRVNERPARFEQRDGYAILTRRWRDGDRISLTLPFALRAEAAPDDPRTQAFLSGPLVLAADLGDIAQESTPMAPALTGGDPVAQATRESPHAYRIAARPEPIVLTPFFAQYQRRTAVYLRHFSDSEWQVEEAAFRQSEAVRIETERRTIDVIHLGEMQPERDHNFRTNNADLISSEGVSGRQTWWGSGNFIEFDLATRPGPITLQVLYWGEDINKAFDISVNGRLIAHETRHVAAQRAFVTVSYEIPRAALRSDGPLRVRFETRGSDAPVYQVRTMAVAKVRNMVASLGTISHCERSPLTVQGGTPLSAVGFSSIGI